MRSKILLWVIGCLADYSGISRGLPVLHIELSLSAPDCVSMPISIPGTDGEDCCVPLLILTRLDFPLLACSRQGGLASERSLSP